MAGSQTCTAQAGYETKGPDHHRRLAPFWCLRSVFAPQHPSEWWSDEELKALSARVVRAAPDYLATNRMRAEVLTGQHSAWEAAPRSAAELMDAATHFDRAAALHPAPAAKAGLTSNAALCRRHAETM